MHGRLNGQTVLIWPQNFFIAKLTFNTEKLNTPLALKNWSGYFILFFENKLIFTSRGHLARVFL